jgi:hypothetical protein
MQDYISLKAIHERRDPDAQDMFRLLEDVEKVESLNLSPGIHLIGGVASYLQRST